MLKIKRQALESALQGARETHPHEFVCLLRGEKKGGDWLIEEVIIPPFATFERHSSGFSDWFIPANSREIASFHSHPSPNSAFPSRQDLHFFSRSGLFHYIASAPYRIEDTNAFDAKGRKIEFEIV